jgi:hypothetical protein
MRGRKSDPMDALAVARAALREPGLPGAQLDGEGPGPLAPAVQAAFLEYQ